MIKLHAPCLIASERDPPVIHALYQTSIKDPSLILDINGHVTVMHLFSEDSKASQHELPEVFTKLKPLHSVFFLNFVLNQRDILL